MKGYRRKSQVTSIFCALHQSERGTFGFYCRPTHVGSWGKISNSWRRSFRIFSGAGRLTAKFFAGYGAG
jgi:hypothetical protein